MDKYRRVEKTKMPDALPPKTNEIRITHQGAVRSYIAYANGLFSDKNERSVVLKAMGNAISKAVTVAEILKHRIAGLYHITRISSIETVDVYEPLEEGLDRIETKRYIPSISIELSLDTLSKDDAGYQSPIPSELVSAAFGDRTLRKGTPRSGRPKKNRAAVAAVTTDNGVSDNVSGDVDGNSDGNDEDSADQENAARYANTRAAAPATPVQSHDGDNEQPGDECKPAANDVAKPSKRSGRRGGAKRKARDRNRVVVTTDGAHDREDGVAAMTDEAKPSVVNGSDAGNSNAVAAAASKQSNRSQKVRPHHDVSADVNGSDAMERQPQQHDADAGDADDDHDTSARPSHGCSRGRGGRGGRTRGRGRGDRSDDIVGAGEPSAAQTSETAAASAGSDTVE